MPYGVDKKIGGDSPENVKWMEKCVSRVTGQKDKNGNTIDKSRAIAICKATLRKSKASENFVDFSIADADISLLLITKEWETLGETDEN